jgi:hypothetical protein
MPAPKKTTAFSHASGMCRSIMGSGFGDESKKNRTPEERRAGPVNLGSSSKPTELARAWALTLSNHSAQERFPPKMEEKLAKNRLVRLLHKAVKAYYFRSAKDAALLVAPLDIPIFNQTCGGK